MQNKKNSLICDITGILNKTQISERTKKFINLYYGLSNKEEYTLELIGEQESPQLTRERVRQIINYGVSSMMDVEQNSPIKPFKDSKKIFDHLLSKKNSNFISLDYLLENEYFKCFVSNKKGAVSFLNDISIKQVVYRENTYLYLSSFNKKDIIQEIQNTNKVIRNDKTKQKASKMSKTVTYVPSEVRVKLSDLATKNNLNLNRQYEQILLNFISNKPYKSNKDFPKTQSWRARQGRAQWEQVGIYISKDVFDKARTEAKKVNVSLMSYICQGFVWGTK